MSRQRRMTGSALGSSLQPPAPLQPAPHRAVNTSPGRLTSDREGLEKALSSTFLRLFRSTEEIKMDRRGSAKERWYGRRLGREQRAQRREAELEAASRTTAGADLFASFLPAVQEHVSQSPQTLPSPPPQQRADIPPKSRSAARTHKSRSAALTSVTEVATDILPVAQRGDLTDAGDSLLGGVRRYKVGVLQ